MAVFLLIGKSSALTMNLAGVIKDWILILLSVVLFGWVGCVCLCVRLFMYVCVLVGACMCLCARVCLCVRKRAHTPFWSARLIAQVHGQRGAAQTMACPWPCHYRTYSWCKLACLTWVFLCIIWSVLYSHLTCFLTDCLALVQFVTASLEGLHDSGSPNLSPWAAYVRAFQWFSRTLV